MDGIGFLLSEQSQTEWPSSGKNAQDEEVVMKDLYSILTFETLPKLHLGNQKTFKDASYSPLVF